MLHRLEGRIPESKMTPQEKIGYLLKSVGLTTKNKVRNTLDSKTIN